MRNIHTTDGRRPGRRRGASGCAAEAPTSARARLNRTHHTTAHASSSSSSDPPHHRSSSSLLPRPAGARPRISPTRPRPPPPPRVHLRLPTSSMMGNIRIEPRAHGGAEQLFPGSRASLHPPSAPAAPHPRRVPRQRVSPRRRRRPRRRLPSIVSGSTISGVRARARRTSAVLRLRGARLGARLARSRGGELEHGFAGVPHGCAGERIGGSFAASVQRESSTASWAANGEVVASAPPRRFRVVGRHAGRGGGYPSRASARVVAAAAAARRGAPSMDAARRAVRSRVRFEEAARSETKRRPETSAASSGASSAASSGASSAASSGASSASASRFPPRLFSLFSLSLVAFRLLSLLFAQPTRLLLRERRFFASGAASASSGAASVSSGAWLRAPPARRLSPPAPRLSPGLFQRLLGGFRLQRLLAASPPPPTPAAATAWTSSSSAASRRVARRRRPTPFAAAISTATRGVARRAPRPRAAYPLGISRRARLPRRLPDRPTRRRRVRIRPRTRTQSPR